MNTVALLGTSHSYQIPGSAESQFRAAIETACLNLKVRSIGEEFCAQNSSTAMSMPQSASGLRSGSVSRAGIALNDEERERLGVRHENMIKSEGWLRGWEQEQLEREARASYSIRERHWLNQILNMNCWPTLFVCGANHVLAFRKLLDANGRTAQVIECDWEPRLVKDGRAATHLES